MIANARETRMRKAGINTGEDYVLRDDSRVNVCPREINGDYERIIADKGVARLGAISKRIRK